MKNRFLLLLALAGLFQVHAQEWEGIEIPDASGFINTLFCDADTLYAGLDGSGVFRSYDSGEDWDDISGNIGDHHINRLFGSTGFMFAATEGGVFFATNYSNWTDNTDGLSFTDASYYGVGIGNNEDMDFAVCTNGGGIFAGPELNGPWTAYNQGLTGDALDINDIAGYSDGENDFIVLGTHDGVYFSMDNMATWNAGNGGLNDNSLEVNRVMALGTLILAATDGGFYYSLDFGTMWLPAIPDETFNALITVPGQAGFDLYAGGDNAYYSPNLAGFYQLSLDGVSGEIIAMAANSEYLFVATDFLPSDRSVYLFRAPLSSIVVGVDEHGTVSANTLKESFPNPARESAHIDYTLQQDGKVKLELYDLSGREVSILVRGVQQAGNHSIELNTSTLPPGIYVYVLKQEGQAAVSRKLMVAH